MKRYYTAIKVEKNTGINIDILIIYIIFICFLSAYANALLDFFYTHMIFSSRNNAVSSWVVHK